MSDFNFRIKLGVDDSEVLSSIRRMDAAAKKAAKGNAPVAPPLSSQISRIDTTSRNQAVSRAANISAADAQLKRVQAQSFGLKAPDFKQLKSAALDSFKRSFQGFELLSKSEKDSVLRQFNKKFKSFFKEIESTLDGLPLTGPRSRVAAVTTAYNRRAQARELSPSATSVLTAANRTRVASAPATPPAPARQVRQATILEGINRSQTNEEIRAARRRDRNRKNQPSEPFLTRESLSRNPRRTANPFEFSSFSDFLSNRSTRTPSGVNPFTRPQQPPPYRGPIPPAPFRTTPPPFTLSQLPEREAARFIMASRPRGSVAAAPSSGYWTASVPFMQGLGPALPDSKPSSRQRLGTLEQRKQAQLERSRVRREAQPDIDRILSQVGGFAEKPEIARGIRATVKQFSTFFPEVAKTLNPISSTTNKNFSGLYSSRSVLSNDLVASSDRTERGSILLNSSILNNLRETVSVLVHELGHATDAARAYSDKQRTGSFLSKDSQPARYATDVDRRRDQANTLAANGVDLFRPGLGNGTDALGTVRDELATMAGVDPALETARQELLKDGKKAQLTITDLFNTIGNGLNQEATRLETRVESELAARKLDGSNPNGPRYSTMTDPELLQAQKEAKAARSREQQFKSGIPEMGNYSVQEKFANETAKQRKVFDILKQENQRYLREVNPLVTPFKIALSDGDRPVGIQKGVNVDPAGNILPLGFGARSSLELLGKQDPRVQSYLKSKERMATSVSRYSTTNIQEAVAESFAARTLVPGQAGNQDIPTQLLSTVLGKPAEEVGAIFDRLGASIRRTISSIEARTQVSPPPLPSSTYIPTQPTGSVVAALPLKGDDDGPSRLDSVREARRSGQITQDEYERRLVDLGLAAPGERAASNIPKDTQAQTRGNSRSVANTIEQAEKALIRSLNEKAKALTRQSDLLKAVYADFSKNERGLNSALKRKIDALDRQTQLIKTTHSSLDKIKPAASAPSSPPSSSSSSGSRSGASRSSGGSGSGRGSSGGLDWGEDGDGEEEDLASAYDKAVDAANRLRRAFEEILDGVESGDKGNLIDNRGMANAIQQYINALVREKELFETINSEWRQKLAQAKAVTARYNQELANEVAELQNEDQEFIRARAESQVLDSQQRAAVGERALDGDLRDRQADADLRRSETLRARRAAALEAASAAGVSPEGVAPRRDRIAAGILAPGDERALASQRQTEITNIRKGIDAALTLDPTEAVAELTRIQRQLDALQKDIGQDTTITINDAAATTRLKGLQQEARRLKKIIEDAGADPAGVSGALKPVKEKASKDAVTADLSELRKTARREQSLLKDALSGVSFEEASSDSVRNQRQSLLTASQQQLSKLEAQRDSILKNAQGPGKSLTDRQEQELRALDQTIQKVRKSQEQLNSEIADPQAIKALERVKKLRSEIRSESTSLGKISKRADAEERSRELANLEARVNQIKREKLEIDTSLDPQAQRELDRLEADLRALEARRIDVASGRGMAGGGGGGGGGGPVAPIPLGGGGRDGERGDIVSRVRNAGGLAGFFGSGALSSIRYGLPSMVMYGALGGISNAITEAEQLQFNLAKIETQVEASFGGNSEDIVRGFKETIVDVSTATGLAADELALLATQLIGAFQDVQIGDITGPQLIDQQIESAAKIAQVTTLPLAEITDGLTAASLAFNKSFQEIGDIAIALEAKSGVLAKETVGFIGDIAPVATEAGFSLEEFSALAVLAQQRSGRSGAALAEQFGRIIPAIAQSREELLNLALSNSALGTPEFITAINQSNIKEILFGIGRAFNSLNKRSKDFVVNLLGGRREAAALLPALANPAELNNLTDVADNAAGKLEERFEKVRGTLTNTFQRLNEEIRKLFVTLFESGFADLFKMIARMLSQLVGLIGMFLKAAEPFLSLWDGLPLKILATVAAVKLLRGALADFSVGFGAAGAAGFMQGGILGARDRVRDRIRAGMDNVRSGGRDVNLGNGMIQGALPFGIPEGDGNERGRRRFGRRNQRPIAPPGQASLFDDDIWGDSDIGQREQQPARRRRGVANGFRNVRNFTSGAMGGAQGVRNAGAGLVSALGGWTGLAITGFVAAYSIIQSQAENDKAKINELKEYAADVNTSIAELRSKANELEETGEGDPSFGSKVSAFFSGKRLESQRETIQSFIQLRQAFSEEQRKIIDILSKSDVDDPMLNTILDSGGATNAREAAANRRRMNQNRFLDAPEFWLEEALDGNKAYNFVVTDENSSNYGKADMSKYIRQYFKDEKGSGKTFGESKGFQSLRDADTEFSNAVVDRLETRAQALGADLNTLDTSLAGALGSGDVTKSLKEIAEDAVQGEGGKYSLQAEKQAQELLKIITRLSKDDPRLLAFLNANGLINEAVNEFQKDLEGQTKDFQSGKITSSQYLDNLSKLRAQIVENILSSSGDKSALFDQLRALDEESRKVANEVAQAALDNTLEIISITQDQDSFEGIQQKKAAIEAAIRSGKLSGQDLRKAALSLVQTQQEAVSSLIRNASSAEEAFAIAARPIDVPIETRLAAIKGQLQTISGNWETFTRTWQTVFGESIDSFVSSLVTGLENGSLTIQQVRETIAKRIEDLKRQRDLYIEFSKGAGGVDQTQIDAFNQAISAGEQIVGNIDQTGQLPGDISETDQKRQKFQDAQTVNASKASLERARAKKNSLKRARIDLRKAENDVKAAREAQLDQTEIDELEAAKLDAQQAVIDAAKAVADAIRGIARARANFNKDAVEGAKVDLQQAQADLVAAIAADDLEGIATAQAAIIDAQAAIRDSLNNRRRVFAQLLKALGSQDSLDQAQYDVNIARMNMEMAVGPEETMQAWMELIAAERAQREAIKRRREALVDLEKAKSEDPVQDARLDLNLAQQLLAEAKTEDERIEAQRRLVDAQRALTDAMNQVRDSQFDLRQAELQAIGDDIGAAQVAAQQARDQLNRALAAGKGAAEINNLRANLITAEKAARDAVFQGKLDEYQYLLDTDQITRSQYVDYLEGLKSTLIPGTKQFKDLEVQIRNLKKDISGNLQTNLPTSLQLPTLYEVRRLNQMGSQFGGPGGANNSIGYQDNRNVQVQVYVNNGMSESQVVNTLSKALNVGTSGLEGRRY